MTFEQLSYVARTSIMAPFINYNPNGIYKLNYDYMESFFYKGYRSSYPDKKEIDSIVLSRIAKYQDKKLNNEDIKYVLNSRKDFNRKPPEKKSWWKKVLSHEPTPLFETEAWKNRRRTDK